MVQSGAGSIVQPFSCSALSCAVSNGHFPSVVTTNDRLGVADRWITDQWLRVLSPGATPQLASLVTTSCLFVDTMRWAMHGISDYSILPRERLLSLWRRRACLFASSSALHKTRARIFFSWPTNCFYPCVNMMAGELLHVSFVSYAVNKNVNPIWHSWLLERTHGGTYE